MKKHQQKLVWIAYILFKRFRVPSIQTSSALARDSFTRADTDNQREMFAPKGDYWKFWPVIGRVTTDYYAIITWADFSKWRRVVFIKVTGEEINNFNKNTLPKSTNEVKKIGLKLFKGKKLRRRTLLSFILRKTLFYLY